METRDRVILLLRDIRWSLGEFAWVVLGLLLIAAVLTCCFTIRWILRGGLANMKAKLFATGQRSKPTAKAP